MTEASIAKTGRVLGRISHTIFWVLIVVGFAAGLFGVGSAIKNEPINECISRTSLRFQREESGDPSRVLMTNPTGVVVWVPEVQHLAAFRADYRDATTEDAARSPCHAENLVGVATLFFAMLAAWLMAAAVALLAKWIGWLAKA